MANEEKTWSRGHFCRLPLAVNAMLNFPIFKESRLRQMANGRSDHVIMISPRLPFTVFRFSVKVNSFVLAISMRIILHHSRIRVLHFEEV